MTDLLQDLRYAGRTLLRSPGFAAAAIVCVALGVGANTTVFSVANALLLRPLPVEEPGRIVRLHAGLRDSESSSARFSSWSYPDFLEYRKQGKVFAGLAAEERRGFAVGGAGQVEQARGAAVSGGYFEVMGVRPMVGRTLLAADDAAGEPSFVAVISRALWEKRFGRDPGVVGKSVILDNRAFTVVGVVGSEAVFNAVNAPQVWIPIGARVVMDPGSNPIDTRDVSFAQVFGRLQPGVSVTEAQAVADVLARQLAAEYPKTNRDRFAMVAPAGTLAGLVMRPEERKPALTAAALLMGVVGIVLLIACANVANLLLARAAGRQRELAIRASLGARRGRIVRQLLTESLVLAVLGAVGGLLLALWGIDLVQLVPRIAELSPSLDRRVLWFTVLVAVVAGIVFGLAPAVQSSRPDLSQALKDGGRAVTGHRSRLQGALIVGQVALALVLVVAAGLVVRTLQNLRAVDPGFAAEQLLVAGVTFARPGDEMFATPPRAVVDQLLERVRALPGVQGASLATSAPLGKSRMMTEIKTQNSGGSPGSSISADFATADDSYFRTLGVPLLRGRGFDQLGSGDNKGVLINQAMARRYWPGRDPIGSRLGADADALEVVGVVGDMRHLAIGEQPVPMFYYRYPRQAYAWAMLHVRTGGDPASLVTAVRREIQEFNPDVPLPEVRPMSEMVSESLAETRLIVTFLGLFGVLALALAAVGIYGIMAYSVAQRTHEIGIRMALGAERRDVVRLVVGRGLGLTLAGVALGMFGAAAATRVLEKVLYNVAPNDPLTFASGALLLGCVALLASYLPARRAARVDPMIALRSE
ncbi:MAG: ABC transporter permease [Gemmatimonadota bacterium]|nr:ABC transporter permease [Gemmatimonadota bacterium]